MLNKFFLMLSTALFLAMASEYTDNGVFKTASYAILILFIVWAYYNTRRGGFNILANNNFRILMLILFLNFVISPYEPVYSLLLKFVGYAFCFSLGAKCFDYQVPFRINKLLLFSTLLIPLILVGIVDRTPHKTEFFEMSNTYTYLGLSFAIFLYTFFPERKNILYISFGFLFLYILSCSSLGILVAVVASVLFINRKNSKLMFGSAIFAGILILLVLYSNITIFVRIRDVITIVTSMTLDDWKNIKDLDLYSMQQSMQGNSGREDNTSVLWRFAHWTSILTAYFEHWYYSILFGLGDHYSVQECGNYPHNEYIRCLCEYGLIVTVIVGRWLKNLYHTIKDDRVFYFISTVFVFHFTENLIDFFVGNALIYFCIGYHYSRIKSESLKFI